MYEIKGEKYERVWPWAIDIGVILTMLCTFGRVYNVDNRYVFFSSV